MKPGFYWARSKWAGAPPFVVEVTDSGDVHIPGRISMMYADEAKEHIKIYERIPPPKWI